MASVARLFERAMGLHRQAAAHALAAEAELQARLGDQSAAEDAASVARQAAGQAHDASGRGVVAWCELRFDELSLDRPLGGLPADEPMYVRIGDARPAPDSVFSVALPLLAGGHIAIDTDVRDSRVAAWFRGILLRVVAAVPDGVVRVLPIDGATMGEVVGAFQPLIAAEAWRPAATTAEGLRAALDEAEKQVAAVRAGELDRPPMLLLAVAAMPPDTGRNDWSRLAALAYAGPAARVHLLVAGYPPKVTFGDPPPRWAHTTQIAASGDTFGVSDPPGPLKFSEKGTGLAVPVVLDAGPPDDLIGEVCRQVAATVTVARHTDFDALMPAEIWQESSATGLRTVIGRDGRSWFELRLDDATPHIQIAGRSGAGKTVLVLDLLYGLASRYSPAELELYLLDFKEGVSFVEFTPTHVDPSWIPHARTVGIESDREYGLAVLRALLREMSRRASELKRAGATKLAEFRANEPGAWMPRIVVVVDEFQVLFAGNDTVARAAAAVLEELARKGRSYGIHLVLASQTISGIDALLGKQDSIFGQFPLRIALAGGSSILDQLNSAADALPIGSVIVNDAGGVVEANHFVRFPNADTASVTAQRHKLWQARPANNTPPAVFAGYEEHHIADDKVFAQLSPQVRRRQALVGRAVDVGLPTVGFGLDATPGRHVAVLGTSLVGADVLNAATLGLARQHEPGTVRFVLAGFAAAADEVVDDLGEALAEAGHLRTEADAQQLLDVLAQLADPDTAPTTKHTYVVVFGADVAVPALSERTDRGADRRRSGLDDLRDLLRSGPGRGVHVLSWWRVAKRFSDAIGGSSGREDVACLVGLNVPGTELVSLTSDHTLDTWRPRTNRALLIDRHDQRQTLIVPFVRPGRHDDPDGAFL